ncbi:MAG: molecular chaperone DnaJ [Candidatus Paceibacterota bacterium]
MNKDYYKILGVAKNSSPEDIKKAFRKLAHKYHPDKTGGDEAKFKEINEAYQVLGNAKKRAEYDMYGNVFNNSTGGNRPGGAWDFDFGGATGGQGFEFDLGDIFGDIFGGAGRAGQRRGRDISVDIQISFKEAVFGTARKILINKVGQCDDCRGSGAEASSSLEKCTTCGGSGQIHETRRSLIGSFTTKRECSTCHGRGQTPKTPCRACKGEGVIKKNEEIDIKIPAGIVGGEMIRMSGRGEATPGGSPGDLYIKIHVDKHPVFRREGYDLLMNLNIKLSDALLGTEYKLETLDGHLTVKIPEGISFGEVLRIKGKGVPMGDNRRGDILVKVVINTPKRLSRRTKKLIEELREAGM